VLAGIVLSCYAVAWLVTARVLYGRWRASPTAISSWNNDVYSHRLAAANPEIAARAMLAALLWPFLLLAAVVRFRPPPTAAERAAVEKELKARIAELEREAGISGSP
jgi:hypothetical protein